MFKVIFLIWTMLSSSMLLAHDEERTIEQKLASLKLERIQSESIIKRMKLIGRMSDKEVAHAKRSIASVREEGVKIIRDESLENLGTVNSMAIK